MSNTSFVDTKLLMTQRTARHQQFINHTVEQKQPSLLNDYQNFLINDKLEQSDDESETDQKNQLLDLPFLKKENPDQKEANKLKKRKSMMLQTRRSLSLSAKAQKRKLKRSQSSNAYVFDCDGDFKIVWDFLCMGLILYEIIAIPFSISFDVTISNQFDIIVDLIFVTDIILNFNTSYYFNGNPIYNRNKIALNYFKFWFWLDLAASFPYSRVIEYSFEQKDAEDNVRQQTQFFRLLRFIRMIKIMRLLRLAKLKVIFDKIDEIIELSTVIAAIMSFFKLSFFVLFWAHWLGCIFHFVALYEDEVENWLVIYELNNEEWYIRYLVSLYWAVTTMNTVGYGDISPQTTVERIFGIFCLLIATGVFSFTLNTIGAALQEIEDKKNYYRKKMTSVNNYMKSLKLTNDLQNQVRRYLSYIWEMDYRIDVTTIANQLNEQLRQEFTVNVNGRILTKCNFLFCRTFSQKSLISAAQIMKEQMVYPDEFIFTESNLIFQNRNLYYIQKGEVILLMEKNLQNIQRIEKGEFFGLLSFFTNNDRTASAKSKYFTNLFYIQPDEFKELIKENQQEYEKFQQIKYDIIENKNYSALNIYCYSCKRDDHVIKDCPAIHFQVDQLLLRQVLFKCEKIIQREYVRRDPTYFHALYHYQIINRTAKKINTLAMDILLRKQEHDISESESDESHTANNSIYKPLPSSEFKLF